MTPPPPTRPPTPPLLSFCSGELWAPTYTLDVMQDLFCSRITLNLMRFLSFFFLASTSPTFKAKS